MPLLICLRCFNQHGGMINIRLFGGVKGKGPAACTRNWRWRQWCGMLWFRVCSSPACEGCHCSMVQIWFSGGWGLKHCRGDLLDGPSKWPRLQFPNLYIPWDLHIDPLWGCSRGIHEVAKGPSPRGCLGNCSPTLLRPTGLFERIAVTETPRCSGHS